MERSSKYQFYQIENEYDQQFLCQLLQYIKHSSSATNGENLENILLPLPPKKDYEFPQFFYLLINTYSMDSSISFSPCSTIWMHSFSFCEVGNTRIGIKI
jgi:hypothetical protein